MSIRTAFILGAGLGTRLRPLTDIRPKPLVPLFGEPLLFWTLNYLIRSGISRFVINTHHLPHVFDRFFGGHDGELDYRGHPIRFVYEPLLLETAGGLRNARQWLGEEEPFLVVNGDIFTDVSLSGLLELYAKKETKHSACITLGLRSGPPQVGVEMETGSVLDFYNKLGREGLSYFLFASVYAVRPEIYRWIPEEGPISMMSIFWKFLHAGERIAAVILDSGFWNEVGNRASYLQLHRQLAEKVPLDQRFKSSIPHDVQLRGTCAVGKGCKIESGAILEDTIVWDGVTISAGSHLQRCIVCDGVQINGNFSDCDLASHLC